MTGLGSSPGILIGFGVGAAASAALEPAFEIPKQNAWLLNPNRVLEPGLLARLVAQGGIDLASAEDEAKRQGFDTDKFNRMVYAAQGVPGTAELLFLWRLGIIDKDVWREGMVKLGQRPDFIDRMAQTFAVPLTAEQAAIAVHRSVIANQGQLPNLPPVGPGKIPRYPQPKLDAYQSAAAYGVGSDQMDALTRSLGLPPGMDLVARMVFRDILDRNDFDLAAAQSNRRREWADAEFEGYRQIPTAHEGIEGRLRGWIDDTEMYAQTARHGMSQADTDLLFKVTGRPLSWHQVFIGLRRGGVYDGPTDAIDPAFLKALRESNIRPEWYNLAWAQRHSLPSAFVIRALMQGGALTAAEGEALFLDSGWPEDLAAKVAAHYGTTATATADKHIAKAQTQLWTETHKSYIAEEIDDATAAPALEAAGVDAGSVPAVLALWQQERELTRKQLSPAKIVKGLKSGAINAATGAAWTTPDALAALIARGYSQTEAQDLINIG